jgi:hypothetical protein
MTAETPQLELLFSLHCGPANEIAEQQRRVELGSSPGIDERRLPVGAVIGPSE